MTPESLSTAKNKDLRSSLAALKRAAQAARRVAITTGTAIVVQRGREAVRITADELSQRGAAAPRSRQR